MAQQMLNGSYYKGSVTVTNRMSDRYAVVNPPEKGKHHKNEVQKLRRHIRNTSNKPQMWDNTSNKPQMWDNTSNKPQKWDNNIKLD